MLKGQAKKDYQREYMRDWQRKKRGSKQGLNTSVRPLEADRYEANNRALQWLVSHIDADGNPVYEEG